MDSYDPKSCSALEKPHYKPIEAALRWCGLIQHETVILRTTGDDLIPSTGAFPQWPCLRTNAEKIHDAVVNGELISCRDGRPVRLGEQVKKERLSVRHTDLKSWMAKHYPDQKPAFLFDEVERITHSAITIETFQALQAEKASLEVKLQIGRDLYAKLRQERDALTLERDALVQERDSRSVMPLTPPGERAEITYLNILGGLLGLMLGKSPAGKPYSVFSSQTAIIEAMEAHHGGRWGISASTLESRFGAANRSLRGV